MIEKMDKEKEANEFMGGRDMKYRVGDRVRIRDWEDMAEEYGINGSGGISTLKGAAIALKMKEFCGKETTIIDKMTQGNYQLEIDDQVWLWPECALLPIEKPQKENPDAQKKYKETTPYENATYFVRAVERYVNTEKFPQVDVILAILGIEKVEEE